MSSTSPLTLEQFEQLPHVDGVRYELNEGALVTKGSAASEHEVVKSKILDALFAWLREQRIGMVFSETSFALTHSVVRMPDASFVRNEQVLKRDPHHIFQCAPDLAVEVVSETESAEELRRKIDQYLQAGTGAVWVVYIPLRMVAIYEITGVREVREKDVLEAPQILPGFSTRVSSFFE